MTPQTTRQHKNTRRRRCLLRIRELDDTLKAKTLEALVLQREVYPERWGAAERKRLEARARLVEEALREERQRRLRAMRLTRAVDELDGGGSVAAGGNPYAR